MALPPAPEGLPAATAADFEPAPAARARGRIVLLAVLNGWLGWRALDRWGGDLTGVVAAVLAALSWLAAVTAQWICLRRDTPVALELASCEVAETDRGRLAVWQLAAPVPTGLARRELEPAWAQAAQAGDQVAARLQETGFGTIGLVLGTAVGETWRLPAPRPVWPPAAQLYTVATLVGILLAGVLAAAPSRLVSGEVSAAQQQAWSTGPGTVPWSLTITLPAEGGRLRTVTCEVSHDDFLTLLPVAGQRVLATPGLLPAGERARYLAQYLPVGRRVRLRRTWLLRHATLFFEGPGNEQEH